MFTLLLALLSCGPGHDPNAYEACLTFYETGCECPESGIGACDATDFTTYGWCGQFNELLCDPQNDAWDAEGCETYHDIDLDAFKEWFNCNNGLEECAANGDRYEACGDFPQVPR